MQVNAINGKTRLVQRVPNTTGNATCDMTPISQNSGKTSVEVAETTSARPLICALTSSALAANVGMATWLTMPESWSTIEWESVFAREYEPNTIGPPRRPSRNVSKSPVTNQTAR